MEGKTTKSLNIHKHQFHQQVTNMLNYKSLIYSTVQVYVHSLFSFYKIILLLSF